MCSIKGIQVLLFIENFIFWLAGSGLVGIGSYLLIATNLPGILQFLSGATTLSYLAIGVGSFLFILGLMGCCGAIYHNDCLLKWYVGVLLLLVAAQIGVGCYIGLGFGTAQLQSIWASIDASSRDVIHTTFDCCGFYNQTHSYPDPSTIPTSCTSTNGTSVTIGCYSKIVAAIYSLDIILLSVGISVGLLELLGIIMSCYLACNKKEVERNQVMPLRDRREVWKGGYR